ncbi:MAG: dockerin type I domain-containing protein [Chloroherpetonaceae bacterium]|nr:dockerin type I domain-containing protein [Chthonomonadaceae bacterium]MDW8206462.1 dockerin type I domain-containing protein [Chloroherpetonaceae bacterium]
MPHGPIRVLLSSLSLLLLPSTVLAQAGISHFEFSTTVVDYPAALPLSTVHLQGSLGQTMVTAERPTNTGQSLAFLGYWETGVRYRYVGRAELEDYRGNPTGRMLNLRFRNVDGEINDVVITPILNATGSFVADSWMNPARVAGVSAKTSNSLRSFSGLTVPPNPLQYPSVDFTGLANLLRAGDATDDNTVDLLDLDAFIAAFDACSGDASYSTAPDFDGDGCVTNLDLDLLIRNFDQSGVVD